jgi:hypothetical protein
MEWCCLLVVMPTDILVLELWLTVSIEIVLPFCIIILNPKHSFVVSLNAFVHVFSDLVLALIKFMLF